MKPRTPAFREINEEKEKWTKAMLTVTTMEKNQANQRIKAMIKLSGGTKGKITYELENENQSIEKALAIATLWILSKDTKNIFWCSYFYFLVSFS